VLASAAADRVIVAFAPGRDSQLVSVLRTCVAEGIQVDVVPRFFDLVGPAPRAHALGGLALVEVPGRGLDAGQRLAKRAMDIVGASLLLLILSPVVLAVALAIAALDGPPVLFRQVRIGRGGRAFSIVKFRTMRGGPDEDGVDFLASQIDEGLGEPPPVGLATTVVGEIKAAGEARTTRLAAALRRTSLDELPQLLNVLRGDMSLVGPRPLRPFEVGMLTPWQLARQELRPGLTGLWQVLGRSDIAWDERIQLDYTYVSHWSFASDLQILARTIPAVLRKEGAV
jgi:lipopolysaccharide/colanic/teichoic acid biosynthesis glycosyltransferase